MTIEGEGQRRKQIKVRRPCDNCRAPATRKHTYLMEDARRNPASSAYGKDDCTWCSDFDLFVCEKCERKSLNLLVPDDYSLCSTFLVGRFPHLFLYWKDLEEPETVRVLRIIEYVGRRDWVEKAVGNSIHGTKHLGVGEIRAATVGSYPEILSGKPKTISKRTVERLKSEGWDFFQTGPEEWEWLLSRGDGKIVGRQGDDIWHKAVARIESEDSFS